MLPLRQVFARSSDTDSRIRDEQDERQPRFFQRELLVDFRKEDREGAWSIQERALPFGFEYLKRASFRDINFGETDEHGVKNMVAGREVEGSALRKQYLVVYDAVPGGTGYLKQLVTEVEEGGDLLLFRVLELAQKRLESCVCWNDPDRDGCYRCLLGYRNSRDMDDVSARGAVELIARILGNKDKLEKVNSLGEVSITGLVDSVLEVRFIEALRQAKVGGRPAEIVPAVVRQKPGYRLEIGTNEWNIEPQVEVNPGVTVSIDFVLHPRQPKRSDGADEPVRRPIAVFLDGWEFHRDRIGWELSRAQAHLRRIEWMESHWEAVSRELALERGAWTLVPVMILEEEIPSVLLGSVPLEVLVCTELLRTGVSALAAATSAKEFRPCRRGNLVVV